MYAIKTEIKDLSKNIFEFLHQKTMYGGKKIATGDTIYIFSSENEGGTGLIARGTVISVTATPKRVDVDRQTPRVSISVRRTALANLQLGRKELKIYSDWQDGRPETELNFKLYRQATNKIIGVSQEVTNFLDTHF